MSSRRCYIVGAGDFVKENFCPGADDYIIAADGGFAYVDALGLRADLVVGDFDSLGQEPIHPNIIRHPVMKDETDLALAAEEAVKRGFRELHIFGATGGRPDHTLAALQMMVSYAKKEVQIFLYGTGYAVTTAFGGDGMLGCLSFDAGYEGTISIFSFTEEAKNVTLKGLLYPLEKAVLRSDVPLGVSNSFTGEEVRIEVGDGVLVVLWYGNENKGMPKFVRKDI